MLDLRDRYASLSERQKATMQYIVNGLANKEVAARLGISPRTVEIYRSSVMAKMGALSFADLVRMSIRLNG
jgi:two-component system response regulator FixJ